ncbi:MAG: AMP-binding protein, partial [Candidatus Methylomirabilis sp.]|nr:AMP-binding protein [Deltaproteobacteria bacterium]
MSAADSNVASLLLGAGRDEAPAILFEDQVVAYAELRDRALGVARALLRDGGRKGDRVGILAENGPFFAAAYLGVL